MFEETVHGSETCVSASEPALFLLKAPIRIGHSEEFVRIVIKSAVPDRDRLWRTLAARLAPAVFAILAEEYQRKLPGRPLPYTEQQVRSSLKLLGRRYRQIDYAGCIEWLIWEDANQRAKDAPTTEFKLSLKAAINAANAADALDLFLQGFLGFWTVIFRGGSAKTVFMPVRNEAGFLRIPLASVDEWSYAPERITPV